MKWWSLVDDLTPPQEAMSKMSEISEVASFKKEKIREFMNEEKTQFESEHVSLMFNTICQS